MQQLMIANWSSLWTHHHLNVHIVKPLAALTLAISEDGSKAYIDFASALAAVQAKKVCEEACNLLRSRQLAAEACTNFKKEPAHRASPVAEHLEAEIQNAEKIQPPSTNPRFMEVTMPTSQPMGPKISPSTGPQHDDDDCGSWMLPLMPGTGGPSSGARRDWATLLSPPLSCGSQSGSGEPGSFNSSAHSEEWMSPCLVSC